MKSEYRLVGRLEAGELAELFRATRDGEPGVVVKLFHARTTDVAYAREAAEQARAAGNVPHPGVVQVVEIGLVRKRLAIVRQDVGGYTLGQALQRLNTKEVILPHALALALVIELLEIVQRAHEAGVVHGAITPGNVLLTKDGRVALCDFGALRALNASPALRRMFGTRGRSSYRSPEVHKGEGATPLSDVYSLGCIAYELLTLREVSGAHTMSVRHHVLPPPSRIDRRINTRLDPIVMRALEGPPNRRFKSCGEMAAAIRELLASAGGMPARDDLKRFVAELFPTEVVLSLSTHVPITEPFRLSEVEGIELEPLAERSMVLEARPSFSGGFALPDEETADAPPVFPEPPSAEANRAAKSVGPPPPDEGTHPGGPVEAEWEAPPGEAPKPKKGASAGSAGAAILKRVRRIKDFSAAPAAASEPEPPPESIFPARKDTDEMPHPVRASTESNPVYPTVTGEGGQMRKMVTEERRLWLLALKKRRMGTIALAIAMVGAFIFSLVVWRFSARNPPLPPPEPISRPPPVAVTPAPKPTPKPPPDPSLTPEQREEPISWHTPPRRGAGFLTIESDRPAIVYVDGQRVRKTTPLKGYPVAAGTRKIAVVETRTGVRREYTLNVQKGQTRKLHEMFGR